MASVSYDADPVKIRWITERVGEYKTEMLSEFFKRFADESRLKILLALEMSDLCVYDLCNITGISQPAVSHHLGKLRDIGAVHVKKAGKQKIYGIADERIRNLIEFLMYSES